VRERTDFFEVVGGCRKQVSIADGCRCSYPLPIEINLPSLALSALCGFGRQLLNYSGSQLFRFG
jgi:hypothetical protein